MSQNDKLRFFTDQNIPESVAKMLEAEGLEVVRLREAIAPDAPDPLVAAIAEAHSAILVTMDTDFKTIAARRSIGRRRLKSLSLVRFERCRESHAAERLKSALSLIQHEWDYSRRQTDRRIFIVITGHVIRTNR